MTGTIRMGAMTTIVERTRGNPPNLFVQVVKRESANLGEGGKGRRRKRKRGGRGEKRT